MLWSVTGDDCERNRGAIYRLLHQAIKQQTTSFRFATIKPKGELYTSLGIDKLLKRNRDQVRND
jgi:hypothetical protein